MREEKARRRAEIRARAQKEAEKQPLLQQVLDHNSADRNTPNIPTPAGQIEHSASPQTSSPNVSLLESAPNSAPDSPGVFVTQKEVTSDNRPLGEEEGNSAAHYDPMKDMLEDQRRAALKQGLGQVTASSYKETLTEQRTVLLPVSEKAEAAPHKKPKKEFDMFADEDDEEEEEEEEGQDEHEMDVDGDEKTTKAVAIPQGRQYHESLLDKWDDEDGYLKIIPGEILEDGRYTIVEVLGRGVFAVVVRATDSATKEQVAIKIVRKNDSMRKAGLKEIYFLKKILEDDPRNKNHIVRFKTSFDHKGHLCMVFENLKQNLRDLVKSLGGHGISLVAVKEYAKQMFIALAALKRLDIIHADLKPDNILTADDNRHIKICDLGSAADRRDNNDVTTYLVSRFYRAPEIILGMKYDFAIDIWAIGCTLFELWTGKILFQGPNNNQMLKAIMECRGKFSGKLLRKASLAGYYFNEHEQFASRELDPFGKETTRWMIFKKPTKDLKTRVQEGAKNTQNINQTELVLFADLLDKCLNINPEKRITPEEALRHPFVNPRAAAAGHGHGHGPNGPGGGGGGGGPSKYKPYAK
ncbi:kinase-like protein [Delitschia confertaspora ATCC 74209]|uniref:non-specific serine/threonine protein kinase n=1 Tax=Delitschia confertaspora ATCC 74209 TaxID=1513339 RepID=A0A9P4JJ58_9PLEO|nr:kinase-like protein [Delitschia confertaspora ATCC 74209]